MNLVPDSRRQFCARMLLAVGAAATGPAAGRLAAIEATPVLRERIHGLLLGSFVGDALGGPIEFQDPARVQALPRPPKKWGDDDILDVPARAAAASRVELRSYHDLRPVPEPYAHWTPSAEPGTVTDDTRHKLVLLDALRRAEMRDRWPFDVRAMAQAFLDWPEREEVRQRPDQAAIAKDWLDEWQKGARWVLGDRDLSRSLPPERMWTGLPTCCGQMTLPPLAALFPGRPDEAYRAAYHLAFFDNGFGRDLNAAIIAGLATALDVPTQGLEPSAIWAPVLRSMRSTDPFQYQKVPWTTRSVDRWLNLALRLAREADRRPARLFAALEREFRETIKWEAQVPFVVCFAVLALADYDPLAALQLSIEWGHDTDSYASLVGAFVGAVHGPSVFPQRVREQVTERVRAEYREDTASLSELLDRLRRRGERSRLIATG